MHFDQRTQRALREAGLNDDAIASASDRVATLVAADAATLEDFFDAAEMMYSDMEIAHSTDEIQTHTDPAVDLYTHGGDLRGYLSLEGWGVPVENGRILATNDAGDPELVELTLGPTIHDRVRFARDRERL